MLLFLLIVALLVAYRLRTQKRQADLAKEGESLRKEALQSKISALRAQMNPHFMFNALNTIQEFIVTNEREIASEYLADFADLMRKYLDQSRQEMISLNEEVETMQLYLSLEQLRFEQEFEFSIECSEKVNMSEERIPVMLLQPFVENAIRHGLLHLKGKKRLYLHIDSLEPGHLRITIEDNGIGREAAEKLRAKTRKKHKSFATSAIQDRVELLNKSGLAKIELRYEDLKKTAGKATGTRVHLTLYSL